MTASQLTADLLTEMTRRSDALAAEHRANLTGIPPCLRESAHLATRDLVACAENHARAIAEKWGPKDITVSPAARATLRHVSFADESGLVVWVDRRLGGRDWHFGVPHDPIEGA